jgi:dTDP-4-dehydrorhamnose 3,5-epimerase
MKITPRSVEGAFEVTPEIRGDARGSFLEWYRWDKLAEAVGHPLELKQANISVSAHGVVRGIHYASVPVGQAKYVTCVRGAVLDVIVDIRVGSPTFGRWEMLRLDDTVRNSVYIAEGLGHAFCALTDDTTIVYMCSSTYDPAREHAVHALDAELAIPWPVERPELSVRDGQAPSLREAARQGLLPFYEDCVAYTEGLRRPHV